MNRPGTKASEYALDLGEVACNPVIWFDLEELRFVSETAEQSERAAQPTEPSGSAATNPYTEEGALAGSLFNTFTCGE